MFARKGYFVRGLPFCSVLAKASLTFLKALGVVSGWVEFWKTIFLLSRGVGPSVRRGGDDNVATTYDYCFILFFQGHNLTLYAAWVISLFAVYLWKIGGKKYSRGKLYTGITKTPLSE